MDSNPLPFTKSRACLVVPKCVKLGGNSDNLKLPELNCHPEVCVSSSEHLEWTLELNLREFSLQKRFYSLEILVFFFRNKAISQCVHVYDDAIAKNKAVSDWFPLFFLNHALNLFASFSLHCLFMCGGAFVGSRKSGFCFRLIYSSAAESGLWGGPHWFFMLPSWLHFLRLLQIISCLIWGQLVYTQMRKPGIFFKSSYKVNSLYNSWNATHEFKSRWFKEWPYSAAPLPPVYHFMTSLTEPIRCGGRLHLRRF